LFALLVTVAAMTFVPLQANAAGFLDVVRAYHEGASARQEEERNAQQLRLMQEEASRLRAEREYLESLKKQIDAQREAQVKQAEIERKEKDRKIEALEAFKNNVLPRIVRVHPDFDSIVRSKEYWEWAEVQEPELKRCAMDSPDASDIIWAVSNYKNDHRIVTLTPVAASPKRK